MFITQPFRFKNMNLFCNKFGRKRIKKHIISGVLMKYIKIKGQWCYLYRAIDTEGHTLDIWY